MTPLNCRLFKKSYYLWIALFCLLFIYGLNLFKNISTPLLWQDEAETAMFAKRILKFGYPKIHDEKNALYGFFNKDLAAKESTDAYIPSGWGQYYFASPGVFCAEKVRDLYLKTALVRIPFAAAGFLGLMIFTFLCSPVFKKQNLPLFLLVYGLLEIMSVPLTLHLREARHYPLTLLLTASILFLYFRFRFFKSLAYPQYLWGMLLLFFLLFNTFYPAFLVLFIFLILYECLIVFKSESTDSKKPPSDSPASGKWKFFLPFALTFFIVLPLGWYFEIFKIGAGFSKPHPVNFTTFFYHLHSILKFFIKQDLLGWILLLKGVSLCARLSKKTDNGLTPSLPVTLSDFLMLLFVFSVTALAGMPVIFERYYIWLQPVVSLIFLLELKVCRDLFPKSDSRINLKTLSVFFGVISVLISLYERRDSIQNHFQELQVPYKGPLDYLIPYIQKNYKNPDQVVIATNFEEHSYLYYLNCKVIVGFFGHELETDEQIKPDIVIYRKGWTSYYNPKVPLYFRDFLKNQKACDQILFPVLDYFCNNSPESRHHLYKTPLPANNNQSLSLYEKFSS